MEQHDKAVAEISAQVKQFHEKKTHFRIYHGSTNSTRPSIRQRDRMVDTSKLNNVLKVDIERKVALVEPNVAMDKLVAATLPFGLVPPVVPEFPGITVGGGFAGTAGESSSFKYGYLDAVVNRIEIVLADGTLSHASRTENQDLLSGAAGTLGTLGVLTLLEMQLIEAQAYVELTYYPVGSCEEAVRKVREATADPSNDFVDGIMFSASSGAILQGKFTSSPIETAIVRFSRRQDPWFYMHAQRMVSKAKAPAINYVPLVDYLFRYDRAGFWVGKFAFDYFGTPFNRGTRWLLDPLLHTRVMFHGLHESGLSRRYIIQDLAFPDDAAADFMRFVDAEFAIYPLWICPLKTSRLGISARHLEADSKMLVNVGVWGPCPNKMKSWVDANRLIESKVKELKGNKWFYAQVFYDEQEFWDLYDKEGYDALRAKFNAQSLPSIFDKVKPTYKEEQEVLASAPLWKKATAKIYNVRPIRGFYGMWRVFLHKEYILKSTKP